MLEENALLKAAEIVADAKDALHRAKEHRNSVLVEMMQSNLDEIGKNYNLGLITTAVYTASLVATVKEHEEMICWKTERRMEKARKSKEIKET